MKNSVHRFPDATAFTTPTATATIQTNEHQQGDTVLPHPQFVGVLPLNRSRSSCSFHRCPSTFPIQAQIAQRDLFPAFLMLHLLDLTVLFRTRQISRPGIMAQSFQRRFFIASTSETGALLFQRFILPPPGSITSQPPSQH